MRREVDLSKRGLKSCKHCRTIRLLDPGKCPPDCDECQKGNEVTPANSEAWELYHQYPSLLISNGMGGCHVDYHAVWRVADEEGIEDQLIVRRFEAIMAGLTAKD